MHQFQMNQCHRGMFCILMVVVVGISAVGLFSRALLSGVPVSNAELARIRGGDCGPPCQEYFVDHENFLGDCVYGGGTPGTYSNACENFPCRTAADPDCASSVVQYANSQIPSVIALASGSYSQAWDLSLQLDCYWQMKCNTGNLREDLNCLGGSGQGCTPPQFGSPNGCKSCSLGDFVPGGGATKVSPRDIPCPYSEPCSDGG